MCFLCAVSRWSRRIASILPWLVIPFILVWALSQVFPPNYRLEVTSSRLACLTVLLLSLLWYELLLPWLSSWRAYRNSMLRERKLIQAREAAKRRKEATRRCRNCLTPYKVQMPGSGKYVCQYCGHISRRPVLEIAGMLENPMLISAGSPMLRGAGLPDPNYVWCGERPFTNLSRIPGRNQEFQPRKASNSGFNCSLVQSLPFNALTSFLGILKKVIGTDYLLKRDHSRPQAIPENLDETIRSKHEKARRKAERKKQTRLRKESFEAEDRQQREEVARLVEERQRQRDELERIRQKEKRVSIEEEGVRKASDSGRQIEKCNKKVGQLEVNRLLNQSPAKIVPKFIQEGNGKVPTSTCASNHQVSQCMSTQRRTMQNHLFKVKTRTDSLSRISSSKQTGVVPQISPSAHKGDVNVQARRLLKTKDSTHVGKPTVSSDSTTTNTRDFGIRPISDSAWKRPPLISAWSKENSALDGNCENTMSKPSSENGNRLDQSGGMDSKTFQNLSLIFRPSPSPVRGMAVQPPIARPANHMEPLQQLFSTPSLFSPLDLCANVDGSSEQNSQNEMNGIFSDPTFFESQNFSQVSNFFVPAPGASNYMMPDTARCLSHNVHDDHNSSSVQPVGAVYEGSVLLGAPYGVQADCSEEPVTDLPPFDVSPLSEVPFGGPSSPPLFNSSKIADIDMCIDKDNLVNSRNLYEDVLQLPSLSSMESLFEMDALTSDPGLSMPEKPGSLKLTEDILADGFPGSDCCSFSSALKTPMQLWDDADNSQKVPAEFVDCITQEIMEDPVITADGHSYERAAIEKWLKSALQSITWSVSTNDASSFFKTSTSGLLSF
ncbi:hypothetical protein KP509_15G072300 [Ceratopteris richardii]|uniref:U-box domain-containing protein n=1 Tax=Ceratopteris richardii TaxID=49495 RepID=A0A8T2T6I7_CERRI|nr:hypothetical protein KP509_15G072300 [Ceratopteris richardii]